MGHGSWSCATVFHKECPSDSVCISTQRIWNGLTYVAERLLTFQRVHNYGKIFSNFVEKLKKKNQVVSKRDESRDSWAEQMKVFSVALSHAFLFILYPNEV